MTELKTIRICAPAQRALEEAGINTLMNLCEYTEADLLALHGVGPKAVGILKEMLKKEGLELKS